jgi:GT2 family glycosyltransferase
VDDVVVSYLHGDLVHAEFSKSLLFMCLASETPISAIIALSSGPNLSSGRNLACRLFLVQHDAPWLFMCDTDMVLSLDTLDRLMAVADPVERPVLGGFCKKRNLDGTVSPTLFRFVSQRDGMLPLPYPDYPDDAVVQVEGTGAACLLIHRSVLEAVRLHSGDPSAPWFRESAVGAPLSLMGEDMTFCLRCQAAGIPVHVHTGIQVGHMKPVMLGQVS